MLADAGHGVDFHRTGRFGMGIARLRFGLLDIAEDLLAAQQVALAGFGQGDAAGGAVQQAGAQVGFEGGHRAGDVRGGEIHALGSGGEASGLRHADEGAHVEEDVHGGSWPGREADFVTKCVRDYG
ncbi:hypothetical protein D3C76_1246240 [compost metagenome]